MRSQCDFLAVRFSSSVNLHYYGRRTISEKLLAIGFAATMRLLSNYFDLLFCCSRYGFSTGDLFKVTPTVIHKHCRSPISCELRSVTLVLLEMISVRDGAFCLHQFDDDVVKSLIECICSH